MQRWVFVVLKWRLYQQNVSTKSATLLSAEATFTWSDFYDDDNDGFHGDDISSVNADWFLHGPPCYHLSIQPGEFFCLCCCWSEWGPEELYQLTVSVQDSAAILLWQEWSICSLPRQRTHTHTPIHTASTPTTEVARSQWKTDTATGRCELKIIVETYNL